MAVESHLQNFECDCVELQRQKFNPDCLLHDLDDVYTLNVRLLIDRTLFYFY